MHGVGTRVLQAFIKRLLQQCYHMGVNFTIATILLVAEVASAKPALFKRPTIAKAFAVDKESDTDDDDDDGEEHYYDVDDDGNPTVVSDKATSGSSISWVHRPGINLLLALISEVITNMVIR